MLFFSPALEVPDGDDRRFAGLHLSRSNGLQCQHDFRAEHNRIDRRLGRRAVAAFPQDGDADGIGARGHVAGSYTDFAGRQVVTHV